MSLGDELRELADVVDRVAEHETRIRTLEADRDWQRQVGVMAACWPYALRRRSVTIPAQRTPHPSEHRPIGVRTRRPPGYDGQ